MLQAIVGYLSTANDVVARETMQRALANASFGLAGDFLGNRTSHRQGGVRGNTESLALWGLAAARGADIFGSATRVVANGSTYGDLVQTTWDELAASWDDAHCGGGIVLEPAFLFGDGATRNASSHGGNTTKTAAANAGFMGLSAHLFSQTGNTTYRWWADKTYNWLVASGLVTSQFAVYESISGGCSLSHAQWSQTPGLLLSALSVMYRSTTLAPYMEQMLALQEASLARFTTSGGVLYEPLCAFGGVSECVGQKWYKGLLVQGLADAYRTAATAAGSSASERPVAETIATALVHMLPSCDDAWRCSQTWSEPATGPYTLNDAFQALELLSAVKTVQQVSSGNGFSGLGSTGATSTLAASASPTLSISSALESTTATATFATVIPIVNGSDARREASNGGAKAAVLATVLVLVLCSPL
nr:hydrolase 76 protein [Polyrhizophydium stewartii]